MAQTPPWLTSTVRDLCKTMRHTQDYSALSILADALQDAGFVDEMVLSRFRDGPRDWVTDSLAVAYILLDNKEITKAEKTIKAMADAMGDNEYGEEWGDDAERVPGTGKVQPMNYAVLMTRAREFLTDEDRLYQYDGTSWQSYMTASRLGIFWKAYRLITGDERRIPGYDKYYKKANYPFIGCSCG